MKDQIKNTFVNLALIITSIAFLNGCNTVQGMGKDVQAGGNAINKAVSGNGSSHKKTTTSTQLTHEDKMKLEKKANSTKHTTKKTTTKKTTTQKTSTVNGNATTTTTTTNQTTTPSQ